MTLSIRLPDDMSARLDGLVAATKRSKTFYVLEAIRAHIDDLEDIYLAEKELEDIRAGRSIAVPLEQVMQRYGLAS